MGKKSLIKSTDKKKNEPKKKESAAKKTTPKKSAATAKKTTKKAASTKKTTTKKTTAKKSVKKATKKVTMKELIFKKFEPLSKRPAPEPAAKAKSTVPPAPEIITSDDPQERKRLRALLMAKYSMEDIKAAAKAPAPEPPKTTDEKPEPPTGEPSVSPKTPEAAPAEVTEDDSVAAAAAIAAAAKPIQPEKKTPPKPTRAPQPSSDSAGPAETDPVQKALKYGVIAFVVLILLLVGASYKNSNNYYIVNKGDAVEIWRGRFSPTGKERLILLHGVSAPEGRGTVYTRNHVFPLAFNYYLEKADALLETEEIPDYEGIREYLYKAKAFAINDVMKDDITARLNNIDLITLIYKIDVSLRKNTADSLDQAAQLVKKAGKLTTNAAQSQLLADKAAEIKERRAALAAAESEAEAAETQEAVGTEEPSSPEK